jgi:hypothetical protein
MSPPYRTQPVSSAAPAAGGAIVVHCSDPRYQPHFQDFIRNGLGVQHYALLAAPGGVHHLTLTEYLPKFSWAGRRWVKFLADLVAPDRIILIGHDDCRWYKETAFLHLHGGSDEAQHADLRRVRAELRERFPRSAVECWFARLEGAEARFDPE